MTLNPQAIDGGETIIAVTKGTVISSSQSGPDGTKHTVTVNPEHTDGTDTALVTEDTHGDVFIPTDGDDVLLGMTDDGTMYVLNATYNAEDVVETLAPGERRLSHPLSDSNITFHEDGSLTITDDNNTTVTLGADGTVVIDDGETAPITDIQTSTDGDGHITTIDVTRADGVFVPSN